MATRQSIDNSLLFSFGNLSSQDEQLPDRAELPGDEVHRNGISPSPFASQRKSRKGTSGRPTRARRLSTLKSMNVRVRDNDHDDQDYSGPSSDQLSDYDEGVVITPRDHRLAAPPSKRSRPLPRCTPAPTSSAQRLKASLKGSGKVKGMRRRQVQDDPENFMIMKLRIEQKLNFTEIAKILNDERIKSGGQPSLTQAACYGRFVRNAPLVAAKYGGTLDPKEFMNMPMSRGSGSSDSKVPVVRFTAKQDEQLVRSYDEVQSNLWNMVAEKLAEKCEVQFTPEECAKRFKAI